LIIKTVCFYKIVEIIIRTVKLGGIVLGISSN